MGELTNGCFGLHGGVESVEDRISNIEKLRIGLGIDDVDVRNKILRELKIITREVTGYLSESTFPAVKDVNFSSRVAGILNGIKDMVNDKAA